MSSKIVRQSAARSSTRSAVQLSKQGYDFQVLELYLSKDYATLTGTLRLAKEGPATPIEQTEQFARASEKAQLAVRGCWVEGPVLDEISIPFRAKLVLGRPRRKGRE